jgi:hypothetical protein
LLATWRIECSAGFRYAKSTQEGRLMANATENPITTSDNTFTVTLDDHVAQFLRQIGQTEPSQYINDVLAEKMNQHPLPLGSKQTQTETGAILDDAVTDEIPSAG